MDNKEEFYRRREKWLKEVAIVCHNWASQDTNNPDFYVFQSRSDIFEPELLLIGANPGNNKKYINSESYKEKGFRDDGDLGYDSNQYIENEFAKDWHINKPILKMFEHPEMRKKLENSVIMNVVYFNTSNISELKKLNNGKEMIAFCVNKTEEFIDLVKPKNILFMGLDAPKWLKIKFDPIKDSVLRKDEKNFLILKKMYKNIPSYIIYHPSNKRGGFNSGESLLKKRNYFLENL